MIKDVKEDFCSIHSLCEFAFLSAYSCHHFKSSSLYILKTCISGSFFPPIYTEPPRSRLYSIQFKSLIEQYKAMSTYCTLEKLIWKSTCFAITRPEFESRWGQLSLNTSLLGKLNWVSFLVNRVSTGDCLIRAVPSLTVFVIYPTLGPG